MCVLYLCYLFKSWIIAEPFVSGVRGPCEHAAARDQVNPSTGDSLIQEAIRSSISSIAIALSPILDIESIEALIAKKAPIASTTVLYCTGSWVIPN